VRAEGIRFGVDYRMLGVVSGGYGEGEQNNLVLETPLASKPGNSGIAIIVPASALKALLDDPQVSHCGMQRSRVWQSRRSNFRPSSASVVGEKSPFRK